VIGGPPGGDPPDDLGEVTHPGTPEGEVVNGGLGADNIAGGAGDDTLRGGPGPDTIAGGAGDDFLRGGLGPDIFGHLEKSLPRLGTDRIHWSGARAGDLSDGPDGVFRSEPAP
jgi:Ca2+-binding RTX toxin-like protein